ncbi:thiamine pyrophosphate-dependent enzyme [Actinoplanes awajinensis]|uniref:Thiamine pyrophosphate enzyme TPP-binding domain-containing protein n=1 Tax=Actinoplanes awajinensis subsp. mycoplanecinus TaxID=135947 RepID=A0A101JFI0_9ACTN|nr:hypothetical protein [Actinoplanes awajinensis]KUL25799.1 hypothetical protein ADL15_39475 [Actinoplanes awajinensis subsp. mycoplanecinus]
MNTREALSAVVENAGRDAIFVSSLGRTSEEMYALRPDDTLFMDSMGDVTAVALGIGLNGSTFPVVAVDTDGSFLMNLSVLPALGALVPALPHYGLVILDNGIYESGGGRSSRSCALDWESLFAGVGLDIVVADEPGDLDGWPKRRVVVCRIENDEPMDGVTKTVDGVESSYLIERAIARRRGVPARRPALKA